jgi:hypothetical protein
MIGQLIRCWGVLQVATAAASAVSFDEKINKSAKKRLLNPHHHAEGVCNAKQICAKKIQDLAFTLTSSRNMDQRDVLANRLFDEHWNFTEHATTNAFHCHEEGTLKLKPQTRYALMTMADDFFVPGLLVMLDSFIRHNPWFCDLGEVLIPYTSATHNGEALSITLSDANRHMLKT